MGSVRLPPKVPLSFLATGLVILGVLGGTVVTAALRPGVTPNVWDYALPLLACAALLVRHRFPVGMLVVVTVAGAVYYPVARLDGTLYLALLLALFTAADLDHLGAAVTVTVLSLLGVLLGELNSPVQHLDVSQLLLLGGWTVATVAMGGVTRNRRAYLREAERRVAEAEHGREEEARRRAAEERLRIARELHDVIGHNISLISVQAGAALHRIRDRPEQAESALTAIKEVSRETLRELRTTLGVLRQVDEEAPTAPAPSLSRIRELTGRSGLAVRVEILGESRDLPAEIDHAAARIIQESLTNVTRHAGTSAAEVSVRYGAAELTVRVDDDGPDGYHPDRHRPDGHRPDDGGAGEALEPTVPVEPVEPAEGGFGITGMRERAAVLGGTLEAGPRPGGGFRVLARIPLRKDIS
ncbi:two-component sensor histidine kinase [Planobispora rosea]|uniref:histidine kinase n=1 Tax=Planobispora rosea TaxID=35762 RepID=A0A8J3WDV6_PLARO|nr:sensor histidine kinase [Planobispora rosea]GGS72220.1 two-component sensor histidine kinase [Planobispora rosea]GIH85247.1 two-component sensor histidine kinase [Planobispora rosea]